MELTKVVREFAKHANNEKKITALIKELARGFNKPDICKRADELQEFDLLNLNDLNISPEDAKEVANRLKEAAESAAGKKRLSSIEVTTLYQLSHFFYKRTDGGDLDEEVKKIAYFTRSWKLSVFIDARDCSEKEKLKLKYYNYACEVALSDGFDDALKYDEVENMQHHMETMQETAYGLIRNSGLKDEQNKRACRLFIKILSWNEYLVSKKNAGLSKLDLTDIYNALIKSHKPEWEPNEIKLDEVIKSIQKTLLLHINKKDKKFISDIKNIRQKCLDKVLEALKLSLTPAQKEEFFNRLAANIDNPGFDVASIIKSIEESTSSDKAKEIEENEESSVFDDEEGIFTSLSGCQKHRIKKRKRVDEDESDNEEEVSNLSAKRAKTSESDEDMQGTEADIELLSAACLERVDEDKRETEEEGMSSAKTPKTSEFAEEMSAVTETANIEPGQMPSVQIETPGTTQEPRTDVEVESGEPTSVEATSTVLKPYKDTSTMPTNSLNNARLDEEDSDNEEHSDKGISAENRIKKRKPVDEDKSESEEDGASVEATNRVPAHIKKKILYFKKLTGSTFPYPWVFDENARLTLNLLNKMPTLEELQKASFYILASKNPIEAVARVELLLKLIDEVVSSKEFLGMAMFLEKAYQYGSKCQKLLVTDTYTKPLFGEEEEFEIPKVFIREDICISDLINYLHSFVKGFADTEAGITPTLTSTPAAPLVPGCIDSSLTSFSSSLDKLGFFSTERSISPGAENASDAREAAILNANFQEYPLVSDM